MSNRNFTQDVQYLCKNILSQCDKMDMDKDLFKNLKDGIINGIRNTIYMYDNVLDPSILEPIQLINLHRYINLQDILSVDDKITYIIKHITLDLSITGFVDGKPNFTIANIADGFCCRSFNTQVNRMIQMIDLIKSDIYLYKLLTLDYEPNNQINCAPVLKPVLKDNTWDEIIYASENNCIPDTWNIGDEIDIALSGVFNETVTLQIWDFNHFDKSDGTGKAGILFGMKNLMKDKQYMHYTDDTSHDTWMRCIIMNNIYNSIPIELRNHIKEVNTYANAGNRSLSISKGLLCKDKVFIPGLSEIDDNLEKQNKTEQGQSLISIFKDKNNRIKRINNGEGDVDVWWTRSPYYDSGFFCYVNYCGNASGYNFASNCAGVCFCFNI